MTGSNLIDILTRRHRDLQDLQGGTTAEYYHLTSAQRSTLTDGSVADSLHDHYADDVLLTGDGEFIHDGSGQIIVGNP